MPVALTDITRASVLTAIDEYDALGQEAFLEKYGFSVARIYRLSHGGRRYDSKAIVGVAHGFATGTFWTGRDFSGGVRTVVRTLSDLGFVVDSEQVGGR
ncbi:hypothetical protein HMPREF0724_11091 [Prescottella equi ATCC 33707]|uniref:ScoMcrA-like N-terminal head domain-containing protein n=1 Tax=Prescottella equi ATCC 33707 TaxID=525370 RepID=E9SXM6_RHOHA|nr:hypothetical protein HMPREF0724_11091 [Prescottella equi ATCC 33707]